MGLRVEEVERLLLDHGCGRIAREFAGALVPGVGLAARRVSGDAELRAGESRLGGGADLPRGSVWPRGGEVDHRLIAQIGLGELAAVWPDAPLPKDGTLSFFFCLDSGEHWGRPGEGVRVVYTPPDAPLVRVPDPWAARPRRVGLIGRMLGRQASPHGSGFWPCAVEMRRVWCVPEFVPGGRLEMSDEERNAIYGELVGPLKGLGVLLESGHRLLGAATPVQGPVEVEAAAHAEADGRGRPDWDAAERNAGEWLLLLQVDSDAAPGFMFGDAGSLYFVIRTRDLMEQRWDRVWGVAQC